MTKHRVLALAGFTLGSAIVLISSPPSLFTPKENYRIPIAPSPNSNSQELTQTPTPSPTAKIEPTTSPTVRPPLISVKPTPTSSPKPTVASQTISGGIFAAGKYGNVQVQIVFNNGVITATKALIYPDADSRSSSISAVAIPILIEQTLVAKDNSIIQGVSQASYTSDAWIASLQSALDKLK